VGHEMKTIDIKKARCVVIPSIAVSMIKEWSSISMSMHLERFENMVSELKICGEIVNFVRHKPTIDLLVKHVGRSDIRSGFEYVIEPGDVIYVVGLATRTQVSGADVAVEPKDLLIYKVWVDVVAPTAEKALREGWIEM